ncbi:MAG TPA: hypothetical protein VK487_01835 [Candidatus Bathyarchaeia archaeon]|nr:hypothetical protein [Candidatus Bathyarchaeia archaeon]
MSFRMKITAYRTPDLHLEKMQNSGNIRKNQELRTIKVAWALLFYLVGVFFRQKIG